MNLQPTWLSSGLQISKSKSTLLALSLGLALGFALGQSLHTHAESSIQIKKGTDSKTDASEARSMSRMMRELRDFNDDWMLRNFDSLTSDFDSFGVPSRFHEFTGFSARLPRLDTVEEGDQVKITAEVPGVADKDLDVTVTDNRVTIKGTKSEELKKAPPREIGSDNQFQAIERSYGSFERTVVLPCKVESDKAQATLKNGVLTLTIPKSAKTDSASKKVEIRTL
jgi:Molecular chaperone (small heat shock protein)